MKSGSAGAPGSLSHPNRIAGKYSQVGLEIESSGSWLARARGSQMSSFVADNPIILSGVVIAHGTEQIVVGDERGNTLVFRWTEAQTTHGHGSPSVLVIDLPLIGEARQFSTFRTHAEGRHVQVRYLVDRIDDNSRVVTYTVIEDVGALLAEAAAPGLSYHPGEAGRMSVGPG